MDLEAIVVTTLGVVKRQFLIWGRCPALFFAASMWRADQVLIKDSCG
jgi:hypothetical protein